MNFSANISSSIFKKRGFTLVEVLASVTIIGILIFLAIPSITSVRRDAEENMAIARGEALNMATSTFIDAYGLTTAATKWTNATGNTTALKDQFRYSNFLAPYISYAPNALGNYMPSGYTIELPSDLRNLTKVVIRKPLKGTQTLGDQLAY